MTRVGGPPESGSWSGGPPMRKSRCVLLQNRYFTPGLARCAGRVGTEQFGLRRGGTHARQPDLDGGAVVVGVGLDEAPGGVHRRVHQVDTVAYTVRHVDVLTREVPVVAIGMTATHPLDVVVPPVLAEPGVQAVGRGVRGRREAELGAPPGRVDRGVGDAEADLVAGGDRTTADAVARGVGGPEGALREPIEVVVPVHPVEVHVAGRPVR